MLHDLNKKGEKVLHITARTLEKLSNKLSIDYFKQSFLRQKLEEVGWFLSYSVDTMCHCLDKYFHTAEIQVYVLLDFCNLRKITKEVFNNYAHANARLSSGMLKTIIAFSSGQGRDTSYREEMSRLEGYQVRVKGFSENEIKKYLRVMKCGKKFWGEDDDSFE